MKLLTLSEGKECVEVDDEDYNRLITQAWAFANNTVSGWFNCKYLAISNEVMQKHNVTFDHIDRNPLNCQKSNLRECTHQQNCCNRDKQIGLYSSEYKGVCWVRAKKRWLADIYVKGERKHLGSFKREIDAAVAYNKAAVEFHGEFACINQL